MFFGGNKYIENWYLYLDYRDDNRYKELAIFVVVYPFLNFKYPPLNASAPVRFDNSWSVLKRRNLINQIWPGHLSKKR